ncbi:hypothetical protein ACLOJK_034355 [Asimina triloba]
MHTSQARFSSPAISKRKMKRDRRETKVLHPFRKGRWRGRRRHYIPKLGPMCVNRYLLFATQLAFTAFIIVLQKFTPYSVNVVILVTLSSVLLGVLKSGDHPPACRHHAWLRTTVRMPPIRRNGQTKCKVLKESTNENPFTNEKSSAMDVSSSDTNDNIWLIAVVVQLIEMILLHSIKKAQSEISAWSFELSRDDDNETYMKIDFCSGNVHVVTSKENWEEKMEEANKDRNIVLINFSTSWCGPCRMIVPTYSDHYVKYSSLIFLMVDVDELLEFSSSWDIRATPTFFFLRNGQQVDKLVSANKPKLEKKVASWENAVVPSSQ